MQLRQPTAPRQVWWLKPAWAFGGTAMIVAAVTAALPARLFEQSWKTAKYFDRLTFWRIVLCVAAFAVGSFVVSLRTPPPVERPGRSWAENIPWGTAICLFRLSFVLSTAGYIFWGMSAVAHGVTAELLMGALTGAKGATYELRESYLITISGLTTMSQFDIAVIVLGALIGFARGWRKVLFPMALIMVLAVLRAIVNSERLAAIELIVPILVISVQLWLFGKSKLSRFLPFAPIIGAAAVMAIFTAGEYSRSWVTFYSGDGRTLWAFAADRLLGYYATALNNTAYIFRQVDLPLGAPYFTMNFLWRFPLVGDFTHDFFRGLSLAGYPHYMRLLENGANPEFNNTGGILLPLIDFGTGFGLLFWVVFGAAVQGLYTSFINRSATGLCLYPAIFVGLIEIPRILYWSDPRFFPSLCMLGVSALLLSRETGKELALAWHVRTFPG